MLKLKVVACRQGWRRCFSALTNLSSEIDDHGKYIDLFVELAKVLGTQASEVALKIASAVHQDIMPCHIQISVRVESNLKHSPRPQSDKPLVVEFLFTKDVPSLGTLALAVKIWGRNAENRGYFTVFNSTFSLVTDDNLSIEDAFTHERFRRRHLFTRASFEVCTLFNMARAIVLNEPLQSSRQGGKRRRVSSPLFLSTFAASPYTLRLITAQQSWKDVLDSYPEVKEMYCGHIMEGLAENDIHVLATVKEEVRLYKLELPKKKSNIVPWCGDQLPDDLHREVNLDDWILSIKSKHGWEVQGVLASTYE